MTVLVPEKIDLKTKNLLEIISMGHFVIIKGSIYKKNITIISIYMPRTEHQNSCNKIDNLGKENRKFNNRKRLQSQILNNGKEI